jgi:5-formyltetrahydrofolate cyclo-ligase
MNRPALRKYYLQKRLGMTDSELLRLDDLLLIQFQQWVVPDFVQTVLSYWPIGHHGEVNSLLFTDFMAFRNPGLILAYPVSNFGDHTMQAVGVHEDTRYVQNPYGIAEPSEGPEISAASIDLVIVPLLTFDNSGYRLGYGKGFYDRYLTRCRTDIIKLGLSYFAPVPEIPDKHEFDIPLTVCVTPERIYEF